ncbi:MAG: TPM domain-containing protein [Nitrospirae bacterium]|nr:TPM domain-containing protein [Nitrospirota bacterium]
MKLFTKEDRDKITAAIGMAEKQTSGEIRLFIDDKCRGNVLDRAALIFEKLEMHKTAARNGVLFYLAVRDHKFAILGDAGINAVVTHGFWDEIKDTAIEHFKKGEYSEGLIKGIDMAGTALKQYFPYDERDKNELSDEIVFGQKDT